MKFALIARDKPGHLDTRKANRAAHLDYGAQSGCVVFAGPLLDGTGEMCGSLIVIEVEDRAAADAWAAGDPYAKAGLFASVEINAWKQVTP
ncbi:MAG: YciI family protein [Pseudomonadota bacterium]